MPDRFPRALCVAGCLALACGGGGSGTDASLDPKPESVTPSEGPATQATAVVISGSNFLARPMQSASGGGQPTIDTRHRVWIGNVELQDVAWVDAQTLKATVPAGAPAGLQSLVVENALGRRGELASAFLVRPNASLQAALAIGASVSVGQEATLTLTLTNPGASPVTNVTPVAPSVTATAGAPAVTILSGPTPATIASIGPGQSAPFTWTLKGSASGTATLSASASGADGFTQDPVSGSASAAVVFQQPAALTVTSNPPLSVSRSTLSVGQAVTVTASLQNTGEAAAAISAYTAEMAGFGTCSASSSPAPVTIAGGASVTLTWTCTASTAGTTAVSATVTATDSNSGAGVSPVLPSSAALTIQTPAKLAILSFLATSPARIGPPSTPSTATLRLQNTGQATASIVSVVPSVNVGTQRAGSCDPTSLGPQSVAAGDTVQFEWTCTPASTPIVKANAAISAVDANSGADISPIVPAVDIAVTP